VLVLVGRRRDLPNDLSVEGFENIAGYGIQAHAGGREILIGAERLLDRDNMELGSVQSAAERLLSEGKTLVFVAIDRRAAGVLAAADSVRPNAARAIAELRELGVGAGHDDRRQPPHR
jgi:Cu+-exporting ATPase